jgi:hypothetical protein
MPLVPGHRFHEIEIIGHSRLGCKPSLLSSPNRQPDLYGKRAADFSVALYYWLFAQGRIFLCRPGCCHSEAIDDDPLHAVAVV